MAVFWEMGHTEKFSMPSCTYLSIMIWHILLQKTKQKKNASYTTSLVERGTILITCLFIYPGLSKLLNWKICIFLCAAHMRECVCVCFLLYFLLYSYLLREQTLMANKRIHGMKSQFLFLKLRKNSLKWFYLFFKYKRIV